MYLFGISLRQTNDVANEYTHREPCWCDLCHFVFWSTDKTFWGQAAATTWHYVFPSLFRDNENSVCGLRHAHHAAWWTWHLLIPSSLHFIISTRLHDRCAVSIIKRKCPQISLTELAVFVLSHLQQVRRESGSSFLWVSLPCTATCISPRLVLETGVVVSTHELQIWNSGRETSNERGSREYYAGGRIHYKLTQT